MYTPSILIAVLAIGVQGSNALVPRNVNATIYTTKTVTGYKTFCPNATSFTQGTNTYTATASQWITVTNCPCTLTYNPHTPTVIPITAPTTHPAPATNTTRPVTSGAPVTQIGSGQIQAPASTRLSTAYLNTTSISSTGRPVTQISDGQIQAPATGVATAASVHTSAAVASAGSVVTQIGGGQIQAPASSVASVSSVATPASVQTSAGSVVTQSGDGQIQAPAGTSSSPSSTSTYATYASSSAGAKESISALVAFMAAALFLF